MAVNLPRNAFVYFGSRAIHFINTIRIFGSDFVSQDFKHFLVLNAQIAHGDTWG